MALLFAFGGNDKLIKLIFYLWPINTLLGLVQLTFDHKQHSEKGKENKKQQRGPEKPKKRSQNKKMWKI